MPNLTPRALLLSLGRFPADSSGRHERQVLLDVDRWDVTRHNRDHDHARPDDPGTFLRAMALAVTAPLGLTRPASAITPLGGPGPGTSSLAWRRIRTANTWRAAAHMDLFDFVNLAADMALDAVELMSSYLPRDVDNEYRTGSSNTPS